MQEWILFIVKHGGSYWAKTSSFTGNFSMRRMDKLWMQTGHWTFIQMTEHIGTLWECICTLQVVSFLVFCVWEKKKCILGALMAFSAPPCTPHDGIGTKTMPSCYRAHPNLHSGQVWSKSDWQFLRYSHFCMPPIILIWQLKFSELCWYQLLQQLHWHLCLPHPSSVKPLSMYHFPNMTGTWLTRCKSSACSSASLRLGSGCFKIKAEEHLDYLLCILGK